MPVAWDRIEAALADAGAAPLEGADERAPIARLHLWPNRSLSRRGFVFFVGVTAACFLVPLLPLVGTTALWAILPFLLIALALVWLCLRASYAGDDEVLSLWPDRMELVHRCADGRRLTWEANPYWVTVHMHPEDGPVENYLTLRGGLREVELGAFLSGDERAWLHREVERLLQRLRATPSMGSPAGQAPRF